VRAFVLGTGSSGNALLVDTGDARILVDAGVGPRKLEARLASLGTALRPGDLTGIVPTHVHGDHFAHAARLARVLRAPLFLHPGIDRSLLGDVPHQLDLRSYEPGRAFRIGEAELVAEHVPHDAPHVALRIATRDHALGVAVDIGRVTRELASLLAACDVALVEANHCSELLAVGDYPAHLKRRLASGYGHLSNAQAAELALRVSGSRLGRIYLCHLSRENNTPERARDVVASAARRIAVEVLPHGAVCKLDVRRARPLQLALPFA
jgi:phosphoribosyl 1,2-cyclic phosphodiesterase